MSGQAGSRKKKGPGQAGSLPAKILASAIRGAGRRLLIPLAVLGIGALAMWSLWRHVRDDVLAEPRYQVTYQQIRLPPPPPWIRTDVKQQALRDASLDEPFSLLDAELPGRIARALELHPWVAKVHRVLPRYPASVEVDLAYRKPVCMVELPDGYYPLDGEGTLLPTSDFTTADPKRYPKLRGIGSPPLGPAGSRWDDARVLGGAAVAATLVENWELWKLAAIQPSYEADGGSDRDEHTFRLLTLAGGEILWGHAPGREISPEPDAAGKIAQLAARFAARGSLEAMPGEPPLDLRVPAAATTARTAKRE